METQQYEFSSSQNEVIKQLADKMRFVSYFLLGVGAFNILDGLLSLRLDGVGEIVTGVFLIIIGFWTTKAASSFQQIVDTQGSDVQNLMGALSELRKLYALQFWLLIVTLVFVILAVMLSLIAGFRG